ncbi:MAG: hypothetical protein ABSF90_18140 [Syntrophobacteraceae bacterium]|jgi:autotransporter translocation and assembly factor TamB
MPRTKAQPSEVTSPPAIDLDIRIAFSERIFVAAGGLDSEWQWDPLITGTAGEPFVKGVLMVAPGNIEFLTGVST